jgi:Tfp pilus assembly protein PilX
MRTLVTNWNAMACRARHLRNTIRRRSRWDRDAHDDAGAVLVLALVFVLAIGLLVVSLANMATNDTVNSTNLTHQRSVEYAADSATSIAVQNVRYSGNPYSSSPANCLPNGGSMTINGTDIWVNCTQQQFNIFSGVTRVINFYACRSATCSSSKAVLQAQITFDDFSVSNSYSCTWPGGPTSTCGTAMTVNSWILETANN